MKLKFIGDDKLFGLAAGKVYDVEVFSNTSYICVKADGIKSACLYSTPRAFAHNWEEP